MMRHHQNEVVSGCLWRQNLKSLRVMKLVFPLHKLGFQSLDAANVIDCLDAHSKPMDNETLIELEEQKVYEDEQKDFSIGDLSNVLKKLDEVSEILMNKDPNVERSMRVRQLLQHETQCYRKLYDDKRRQKQTTMKEFFSKK